MYVTLRDGESQEALLKRFQRGIQNSGLLREIKQKRFFISPGERNRIAARKALARYRRRLRREAAAATRATARGRSSGPGDGPGRGGPGRGPGGGPGRGGPGRGPGGGGPRR